MKRFFIISQPYSGSSLLASIFNNHPQIDFKFESMRPATWSSLQKESNDKGSIWGTKVILRNMYQAHSLEDLEKMFKNEVVIYNERSKEGFLDSARRRDDGFYSETTNIRDWHRSRELYLKLKAGGSRVIATHYEDLVDSPYGEGLRLMNFLDIPYDKDAIKNAPKNNMNSTYRGMEWLQQ